jgi:hypothetical protein
VAPVIPGPLDAAEMQRFLDTFLYHEDVFLVDRIREVDPEERRIEAVLDTGRALPISDRQRVNDHHPAHVSAPETIMVTGCLGCLHAWFFHGCRWDEGWAGFGNRIHRADFRKLARRGPPLELQSLEVRSRKQPRRLIVRYQFRFRQDGELVYFGEQSAMFVRD